MLPVDEENAGVEAIDLRSPRRPSDSTDSPGSAVSSTGEQGPRAGTSGTQEADDTDILAGTTFTAKEYAEASAKHATFYRGKPCKVAQMCRPSKSKRAPSPAESSEEEEIEDSDDDATYRPSDSDQSDLDDQPEVGNNNMTADYDNSDSDYASNESITAVANDRNNMQEIDNILNNEYVTAIESKFAAPIADKLAATISKWLRETPKREQIKELFVETSDLIPENVEGLMPVRINELLYHRLPFKARVTDQRLRGLNTYLLRGIAPTGNYFR